LSTRHSFRFGEGNSVGADADYRHHVRPPRRRIGFQTPRACPELVASQFVCSGGRPRHQIGDADAPFEEVTAIRICHTIGDLEAVCGDTRLMQGRIETVAGMGEVGTGSCRPQPGIDSHEQKAETGTDQVGNGLISERFEFDPGETHRSIPTRTAPGWP
jgi:hypothetical protein